MNLSSRQNRHTIGNERESKLEINELSYRAKESENKKNSGGHDEYLDGCYCRPGKMILNRKTLASPRSQHTNGQRTRHQVVYAAQGTVLQGIFPRRKQSNPKLSHLANIMSAKRDPTSHDQADHAGPSNARVSRTKFIEWLSKAEQRNDTCMIKAPHSKRPVGPMPKSHDKPSEKKCPKKLAALVFRGHSNAIPAFGSEGLSGKREIEVVAYPCRERNMPTFPEIPRRHGEVRPVEVVGKVDAHHPPRANGDVGITTEIKINLEPKQEGCHPDVKGRERVGITGKGTIHQRRYAVGEHNLFNQARQDEQQALVKILKVEHALPKQLWQHLARAQDGPRNQLRPEGHIHQKCRKPLCWLLDTSVDIDGVADGLKSIKRNPQRQDDPQPQVWQLRSRHGAGHLDVIINEIGVFEEYQQKQVDDQAAPEPPPTKGRFPSGNHPAGGNEIHPGGKHHQQGKLPAPEAVKRQAANCQ